MLKLPTESKVGQILVSLTLFRTIQKLLDGKKALGGPERGIRYHSQNKQQLTLTAQASCARPSFELLTDLELILILTTSP